VYNAALCRQRKTGAIPVGSSMMILVKPLVNTSVKPVAKTTVDWQRRARIARALVAGNCGLLLLLIAASTLLWPGPDRAPNPTIWILQSLPLLVVLPGILRGGVIAHAWLSFIAMLYFAMSAANLPMSASAGLPPLRVTDILQLIFSVEIFIGAMLYVRWRSRAVRAAQSGGLSEGDAQ
jgi:uncharacterized membrane protein